MTVYYNQVSLSPATGDGQNTSNSQGNTTPRPLRTPEQAIAYLQRRNKQRRQRVKAT